MDKIVEAINNKLKLQWYVLEDPPPNIFPVNFNENGVLMEVRAWTSGNTWFELYSNISKIVEESLKELNIPYSYPKRLIREMK